MSLAQIRRSWDADLARVKLPPAKPRNNKQAPEAVRAQRKTAGKWLAEMPMLKALLPEGRRLEKATDDRLWKLIAALHTADATLDARSVKMMRRKHPTAHEAARLARTKKKVEDPMLKVIANFQRSVAEDTVRNEYQLHRRIHEWLIEKRPNDVEAFNGRVYAELFLTPEADQWLGLGRGDTYTALPQRGIVEAVRR